jgi:hypothetical protein
MAFPQRCETHVGRTRSRLVVRVLLRSSKAKPDSKPWREVTEVTGKYTLREQSESYGVNFAHENEALRSLIPAVLCPTTLAQIKPAVDLFSRLLDRIDKPNVYKILNLRWGLVPLLGDERDRAR